MKYKENLFLKILLFIYVFIFNFENMKLFLKFGDAMNMGIYNLIPLTLFIYIIKRKIYSNKITKYYIGYLIYFLLLSGIILIFDHSILKKTIQLTGHIVFQFLTVEVIVYLMKEVELNCLKKIFNFNGIFMFLCFCFEICKNIQINSIGKRIVLLSSEPSEAGYITTIFYIIIFWLNKSKLIRGIILFAYGIMQFYITSKGTILVFFISLLIMLIIKALSESKRILFYLNILSISLCIFYITFYKKIKIAFTNDIKRYTSVITRSWSILTSIKLFFTFPLGTSGKYLKEFAKIGEETKKFLMLNFEKFNYREIEMLLSGNKKGLVPKATFFFNLIVGGVGYIIFQYFIFRYFYKNLKKDEILLFLIIFIFISLGIYTQDNFTGTTLLAYSFLIRIIYKRHEGEKNDNTF